MKFKNGDRVKISINSPLFYKEKYSGESIIMNDRLQNSLELRLINHTAPNIFYIQGIYLEHVIKNKQLHFMFK
jgi:hypothetical protein